MENRKKVEFVKPVIGQKVAVQHYRWNCVEDEIVLRVYIGECTVTSVLNNGKDVIVNDPGIGGFGEITLVYREKQWQFVSGNVNSSFVPCDIVWKS